MPIYQIKCSACSFTEEYIAPTFDSLLMYLRIKNCPRCEGGLERIPSASNFKIQRGTPKFSKGE